MSTRPLSILALDPLLLRLDSSSARHRPGQSLSWSVTVSHPYCVVWAAAGADRATLQQRLPQQFNRTQQSKMFAQHQHCSLRSPTSAIRPSCLATHGHYMKLSCWPSLSVPGPLGSSHHAQQGTNIAAAEGRSRAINGKRRAWCCLILHFSAHLQCGA